MLSLMVMQMCLKLMASESNRVLCGDYIVSNRNLYTSLRILKNIIFYKMEHNFTQAYIFIATLQGVLYALI